jgi:hypothetical protein
MLETLKITEAGIDDLSKIILDDGLLHQLSTQNKVSDIKSLLQTR